MVVGDGRQNPSHDLSGTGLRHIRHQPYTSRLCDLPDLLANGIGNLFGHFRGCFDSGFQGDIQIRFLALDVMVHGNHGGFRHFRANHCRGFNLFCPEPVTGYIDHVIDSSQDSVIPILGLDGGIPCQIRPVSPVFAVGICIVPFVIGADEPVPITPDGLKSARPWVLDADVTRFSGTCFEDFPFLIVNHGMNARNGRAGATGFHGGYGRHGAAEKPACFRLPPGIDDDRLSFAHLFVVPLPHFGFDGLPHGGHVFEVIIIFGGLIGPDFSKCPDGGRCCMEDINVQILRDPPGSAGIGVGGNTFINYG